MCDDLIDDMIEHDPAPRRSLRRELGSLALGLDSHSHCRASPEPQKLRNPKSRSKTPTDRGRVFVIPRQASTRPYWSGQIFWHAPGVPGRWQTARGIRLRGTGGQTVLPHEEGADGPRNPTSTTRRTASAHGPAGTLSPAPARTDAQAFFAWLDGRMRRRQQRKLARRSPAWAARWCPTAAIVPERIGAGATFHGRGTQPTSRTAPPPHPEDARALPARDRRERPREQPEAKEC